MLLEGGSTGQSNVPGSSNRQTWAYIPALPLAAAGSQDTGLSHPQACHLASVDYGSSYCAEFRVTDGYQPFSRLSNGKCSRKVSYFYHYVVGHAIIFYECLTKVLTPSVSPEQPLTWTVSKHVIPKVGICKSCGCSCVGAHAHTHRG